MKTVNIEVPEGYEIDPENKDPKVIKFRKIEKKYPTSVSEIEGRRWYLENDGTTTLALPQDNDINQVSSQERAEAFLALMQLVELRDAWNVVDGNTNVDWSSYKAKYIIEIYDNEIFTDSTRRTQKVLHFGSIETRDLFLETFRDLIETAKELL